MDDFLNSHILLITIVVWALCIGAVFLWWREEDEPTEPYVSESDCPHCTWYNPYRYGDFVGKYFHQANIEHVVTCHIARKGDEEFEDVELSTL